MKHNTSKTTIYYMHAASRSILARMIPTIFRLMGTKKMVKRDLGRKHHKHAEVPKSFSRLFQVDTTLIEGKSVWTISPQSGKTEQTVLYIHGGAYIYGIHTAYWAMIKEMIIQTKATFIIPDYPLTPEHTAEDVYAFIHKVYEWATSQKGYVALHLLGDSAGAGIAFGFTQQLRNEGKALPYQLILLSPWLDANLDNPKIPEIEKKDPQLSTRSLRLTGKAYAGKWGTRDYRVSPIYGDLGNLPQTSIFISTHDIFYADTEKLRKQFEQEGIRLNYFVYPRLFHDWLIIPKMKEAQSALQQLRQLIH